MWRATWPGASPNTSGGGTPGVATINFSNAVGPTSGPGVIAPITPPYAYSNQYAHRTSYSQVFLLDIQKQVGKDWMFEAGYMGNVSRHLYGFRNANYSVPVGLLGPGAPASITARTPYPNYGVIQLVHDIGVGNYNAFAFQVNKRFSNGFNLISSYTYSKSMDDTSGIRTQSSELFPLRSLVERACVDDLLGGLLAAQDDEQVGDHSGLALFVQLDHAFLFETLQGQLDHADRAFDDPEPSADHGAGRLLAQHGLGDLRRIGQPGQPGLNDVHPGLPDPVGDLGRELPGDLLHVLAQR